MANNNSAQRMACPGCLCNNGEWCDDERGTCAIARAASSRPPQQGAQHREASNIFKEVLDHLDAIARPADTTVYTNLNFNDEVPIPPEPST